MRSPPSPPPTFDRAEVLQNQAFLEPPENDGVAPQCSTGRGTACPFTNNPDSSARNSLAKSSDDIIFTGTPEGVIVGMPKEKQVWLKAGDRITSRIAKLSTLTFDLA
jgi:hypothetical protein